jgi:hypothetical protein
MTTPRTPSGLLLAAAIALVAAAPAAAEETPLVPPENSAVNQYTEGFPTAGGDKDAHDHDGENRSPKKVLGNDNAKKLRDRGPAGQATAELAAETAPSEAEVEVEETVDTVEETDGAGVAAHSRGGGGGSDGGGEGAGTARSGNRAAPTVLVAETNGSSGLSEVLARATGSSSTGGMGIFLPLLIIATVIWAFAYFARQRRPAS